MTGRSFVIAFRASKHEVEVTKIRTNYKRTLIVTCKSCRNNFPRYKIKKKKYNSNIVDIMDQTFKFSTGVFVIGFKAGRCFSFLIVNYVDTETLYECPSMR